jgi:hypothetical protein
MQAPVNIQVVVLQIQFFSCIRITKKIDVSDLLVLRQAYFMALQDKYVVVAIRRRRGRDPGGTVKDLPYCGIGPVPQREKGSVTIGCQPNLSGSDKKHPCQQADRTDCPPVPKLPDANVRFHGIKNIHNKNK